MTKWEYKIEYWALPSRDNDSDVDRRINMLVKELNEYGNNGWELFNAGSNIDFWDDIEDFWVFKRPILCKNTDGV